MELLKYLKVRKNNLHFRKDTEYYSVELDDGHHIEYEHILKKDFDKFISNINKPNVDFFELKTKNGHIILNKPHLIVIRYEPLYEDVYKYDKNKEETDKLIVKYKRLGYKLVEK